MTFFNINFFHLVLYVHACFLKIVLIRELTRFFPNNCTSDKSLNIKCHIIELCFKVSLAYSPAMRHIYILHNRIMMQSPTRFVSNNIQFWLQNLKKANKLRLHFLYAPALDILHRTLFWEKKLILNWVYNVPIYEMDTIQQIN